MLTNSSSRFKRFSWDSFISRHVRCFVSRISLCHTVHLCFLPGLWQTPLSFDLCTLRSTLFLCSFVSWSHARQKNRLWPLSFLCWRSQLLKRIGLRKGCKSPAIRPYPNICDISHPKSIFSCSIENGTHYSKIQTTKQVFLFFFLSWCESSVAKLGKKNAKC